MHCLRHRGPDEHGTWHDADLVFGFNRLSIIDIEHSHQPLRWGPPEQPDRYALTFNGEIYNYLELREELADEYGATFETEGDSEAIVAAFHHWGAEAVRRLRGMFAFAIWDTENRELFLARDPFGIKPLFIATGTGRHRVRQREEEPARTGRPDRHRHRTRSAGRSSTTRSCSTCPSPRRCTRRSAGSSPGCYARLTPGRGARDHAVLHTDVPGAARSRAGREQARYREIAEALEDSVAKHMRADVTVGSFLSGGIDSTAIAALAMRHNPNLITFTTGFEREGYSEVDVAAESAAAIGARHVVQGRLPRRVRRGDPRDRLVPRRSRRRPGAGAAVLRRQGSPQARQGGAVGRGRRRAVRRLHDLPGAAVARAVRVPASRRCAAPPAGCPTGSPRAPAARACCIAAR